MKSKIWKAAQQTLAVGCGVAASEIAGNSAEAIITRVMMMVACFVCFLIAQDHRI